jgi:hypothetical protein
MTETNLFNNAWFITINFFAKRMVDPEPYETRYILLKFKKNKINKS